MVLFKKNCTFSKDPEGVQHFPGGSGGGGGGGGRGPIQLVIFRGGVRTPFPLDPHMKSDLTDGEGVGEGAGEGISVFQVFRPLPRPVTYLILLVGP